MFSDGLSELIALIESHGGFEVRFGSSEEADTFVAVVPCRDGHVERELMVLSGDNARILCFARGDALSGALVEEMGRRSRYQKIIPFDMTHQIYWQILAHTRPAEVVTCSPGTMIESCIRQSLLRLLKQRMYQQAAYS